MGEELLVADCVLLVLEFEVPDVGEELLEGFLVGVLFHEEGVGVLVLEFGDEVWGGDDDGGEVLEGVEGVERGGDLKGVKEEEGLGGGVEGGEKGGEGGGGVVVQEGAGVEGEVLREVGDVGGGGLEDELQGGGGKVEGGGGGGGLLEGEGVLLEQLGEGFGAGVREALDDGEFAGEFGRGRAGGFVRGGGGEKGGGGGADAACVVFTASDLRLVSVFVDLLSQKTRSLRAGEQHVLFRRGLAFDGSGGRGDIVVVGGVPHQRPSLPGHVAGSLLVLAHPRCALDVGWTMMGYHGVLFGPEGIPDETGVDLALQAQFRLIVVVDG